MVCVRCHSGFKSLTGTTVVLFSIVLFVVADVPTFSGFDSYITRPENLPINSVLFSSTVTDNDKGDLITISMDSLTQHFIKLSQKTGTGSFRFDVKLNAKLDKESEVYPSPIRLKFKATDLSGNEINAACDLYIKDINDNRPMFQNLPYNWDIHELPFDNTTFYQIYATDLDTGFDNITGKGYGYVTYTMEPTTQSARRRELYKDTFMLDATTGHVTLKKAVDYEKNNYFQFQIKAEDGCGLNATTTLIIRVLDVQDMPPFFTGKPYRTQIEEDVTIGSSVILVDAEDGDTGVPNNVYYTIGGECSSLFNISQDGYITTSSLLDRDSGPIDSTATAGTCNITVTATEVNTQAHQQFGANVTTTDVLIEVKDVNDNPPTFSTCYVNASVPENTPVGITITLNSTIAVSDIDQEANADISMNLEWMDGSDCSDFKAIPGTIRGQGNVTIIVQNTTLLDYEITKNLSFKLIATSPGESNFNDTVEIFLQITDVNDNNPDFGNVTTEFYIDENSPSGTSVGTVTATDEDSTSIGRLVYSISGGSERFEVNQTTGYITTNCPINCSQDFDREINSAFTISYSVVDEKQRPDFVSLTVHLNDENDNIPTFYRKEYRAYIVENDTSSITTPIIKLDASDKDATAENNDVSYYIILDTPIIDHQEFRNNITLNSTTGELFLNSPVDYEKLPNSTDGNIRMHVLVNDSGHPTLNSTVVVIITVQDENDNAPVFTQTVYTASVPENATSNTTDKTFIRNISAHDDDGTRRNSEFHYFFVDGSFEKFAINSSTGEVTVQINAELDREMIPMYNITINAIDQGSPAHTSTASLFITVTDVNDEPPKFDLKQYVAEIPENATNESMVITAHANDMDSDNKLVYSIVNVTAVYEYGRNLTTSDITDWFSINPNNGTVFVKSTLDRETASEVTLNVTVEDENAVLKKPQIDTASVKITIADVNDNDPQFENTVYNTSVIENAPNNYILMQLTATDKDLNNKITYTLKNAPNDSFVIDPNSGTLKKVGKLDRETKAYVILTITATDVGASPRSSSVVVNVTITDFNDNPPVFPPQNLTIHVLENITVGSVIRKYNATDKDAPPDNNNITYYISSGDRGNFTINETTGALTVVSELDRETIPSYSMIIQARDNPKERSQQKSSTTTLSIIIDDINDNRPLFKSLLYEAHVVEDAKNGTPIIKVVAEDLDEKDSYNSKMVYSFENKTNLFSINDETGDILVNANLKDKITNCTLTVIAEDFGQPRLKGNTTVTIRILDVNLWPPNITMVLFNKTINVFECVPVGTVIYKFKYTDRDFGMNADAQFSLRAFDANANTTFMIFPNGSLATKQPLDAQRNDLYKLEVQVTDHGTPPLSSKVVINIRVKDVNDHDPSFDEPQRTIAIRENITNIPLMTVEATDVDRNSIKCYSIPSGQNWGNHSSISDFFNISKTGGEIFVIQELDYETTKALKFDVHVKDCSNTIDTKQLCKDTKLNEAKYPNTTVHVTVEDANDNPPVFTMETISIGMRRTVDAGTVLKLQMKIHNSSYITDRDSPQYGYMSWVFSNNGTITSSDNLNSVDTVSGVEPCADSIKHIFCIDGNGTVTNNKFFSEDMFGFFNVPIRVSDMAGSSKAVIKVYLIGDSQILMMTVLDTKEEVSSKKDDILRSYGGATGHTFIYDGMEDHKEGANIDPTRTDLFFHVVSNDDTVLSAKDAERLVDRNAEKLTQVMRDYHVLQVRSSRAEADTSSKTSIKFYVAIAVAVVLGVTLILVAYAGVMTKNRYQRKLKAATVKSIDTSREMVDGTMAIPGSNQYSKQANPLLNAQIESPEAKYDAMSLGSNNSIDINEVDNPQQLQDTVYDKMEEREVTLDMFTEDSPFGGANRGQQEDPLAAALRLHELQKSRETLNDDETYDRGSSNGSEPEAAEFRNYAFDDMESSDI